MLAAGQSSGYDLSKLARHNVDLILAPTKSRIYAVLPLLLERGFVSERAIAQERRPDKRLFRITKAGRRALEAWLNDASKPLHRDVLLLKLFFGEFADPASLLEQVEEFRVTKEAELDALSGFEQPPPAEHAFRNLTVLCGIELARTQIEWARQTAAALEELAGALEEGEQASTGR